MKTRLGMGPLRSWAPLGRIEPSLQRTCGRITDAKSSLRGFVKSFVTEAQRVAGAVLAFEARLAEAHWSKLDNRDSIKTYN